MTEPGSEFTHFDGQGKARMVDVGRKPPSERTARARARVRMAPATLAAIREGTVAKGAVLGVARVAGIMGAKRTSDLIPLCHPLSLTHVEVDFGFPTDDVLEVVATARVFDRTGVEMEALTACAVAALTVYDMCKAKDRGMAVEDLRLLHKSGGKSGTWNAPSGDEPGPT